MSNLPLRKELKEKFLRDLSPSERIFFLKKSEEVISLKGYRASENLFYYCYYLTLQERFRGIAPNRDEGILRFLLVEVKKDVEEALKLYEARIEETKLSLPDERGDRFVEYFTE